MSLRDFIHELKNQFGYDQETARNHLELNDAIPDQAERDALIDQIKREVNDGSLPGDLSGAIEIDED